jgi:ribosomal protein S18 acetylase RimI-like enzyme
MASAPNALKATATAMSMRHPDGGRVPEARLPCVSRSFRGDGLGCGKGHDVRRWPFGTRKSGWPSWWDGVVLELARGLSSRELEAVAELEARTVEVDGGRLKLEWGVLNARTGRDIEDILWWEGDRLLGFLGLYAFGPPTVELAGMVDPAARRRGIATALLDAALSVCRDRGYRQVLLVTSRASSEGRSFALSRGAVLEHSEHALVLLEAPTDGHTSPKISMRMATSADTAEVSRLLTAAFGWPPSAEMKPPARETSRTLLVEISGTAVGTLRLTRDEDAAGIYGFAVDPAWQGRGIGRDVLRRICHQLRQEGVHRIGLEVAVDNDHAMGLYTSLGFTPVTTEDYYALPSI